MYMLILNHSYSMINWYLWWINRMHIYVQKKLAPNYLLIYDQMTWVKWNNKIKYFFLFTKKRKSDLKLKLKEIINNKFMKSK